MWHMRRIRLESVGHPDARFDPLTLELIDANGDPTDSVLWLENMGGKTSWVSLVLSVLRPDRREFLGALRDQKHIEDYVLGPDTAHVVIEWQRLGPPSLLRLDAPRLVTGQVLQWKDRRVDLENADKRLQRRFYGFVADDSLDFDRLPFRTPSGQRRALSDFVETLARALVGGDAQRPTHNHHDWHTWLEQHGLDPEVFRYQLLMNADEGAVAEQFKWADGNAFVRWALPYVVNPTVPEEIAAAVDLVRELIGRRGALELEGEFCTRVGDSLQRTAEAHTRFLEATAVLGTAFDEAVTLAARLEAGRRAARARAEAAESRVKTFATQTLEASRQAHQCGRQRAEALLIGADLKIQELAGALARANAHHTRQQLVADAWDAVPLMIEAQRQEHALNQVRRELDADRTESGPLRETEAAMAAKLARRLTDVIERATGERDAAQTRARDAADVERRAQTAALQAETERAAAIIAESAAASRLAALDEEIAAGVGDELLQPGEPPAEGASRWSHELEMRAAERTTAQQRDTEAMVLARGARDATGAAQVAFNQAQARYDAALEQRQELETAEARLRGDLVLMEAAQQTPFDPWHASEVVLERLAEAARAAAIVCVRVEVEAADDRRAELHLRREQLLPPSSDVERALAALHASGVHAAWSGWQVLRDRHLRGDRALLMARHPELANGILLRDGVDLSRAQGVLAAVELGLPLVMAPIAALEQDARASDRIVLGGSAALFDEEAARDELGRRTARLGQIETTLEAHRTTEQSAREAASRYRVFLARWPAETRDQVGIEVERSREERDIAACVLAAAKAQEIAAETALTGASDEMREAEVRHGDTRLQAERARDLARRAEARPIFERERQGAGDRRTTAESALEHARQEATRQRERAEAAQAEAADAEGCRREAANQLARCGVGPTTDGPVPSEPPDVLEDAWRQARAALEHVRREDMLLAEEQRLTRELAQLQGALNELTLAARAEAERLVARSMGIGPADRTAERQQARDARDAAAKVVGGVVQELGEAKKVRHARDCPAKDRSRLDVPPATAAEAEALAEVLQSQQTQHNTAAGAFDKQRIEYVAKCSADTDAAERLENMALNLGQLLKVHAASAGRSWPLPAVSATSWAGSVSDAEHSSNLASHHLIQHAQARSEAAQHRQSALSEVGRTANDARFASLVAGGPFRDRLLHDHDDIRAAGAAEMARQLEQRARTIERDLAQIGERRQKIADLLVGQVRNAVQLLAQLQNQSRLPDGLDEWSGRPYLTVRHDGLQNELKQLVGRVATVVDRACEPAKRHEPAKHQRSDGITLLYEGLRAAVGDFVVEILKPGKVLRLRRVPVAEIRTFSGGQKITAALVLFAALTRLRELNRLRDHHLGRADVGATLILDNPIGKASAGTLIEVQRRVAERCRLQLIYTTGVSDLGALGLFTCVVRLDGKENLRTGAQHVVEVEHTVQSVRLVQRRVPQAVPHA